MLTDALATARLTRLLTRDRILEGPRATVLNWALERRYWKLADFVVCPWCVSVWVAAGVVGARVAFPRAWPWVARALAASEVAGLRAELGSAH